MNAQVISFPEGLTTPPLDDLGIDEDENVPHALRAGGGDGTYGGMDARVTRLEQWARIADQRSARIEDKLDKLTEILGGLAA